MKRLSVVLSAAMFVFLVFSCGDNQKENAQSNEQNQNETVQTETASSTILQGDYVCTQHWNDALVGKAKITFYEDGKVDFSGGVQTTYRLKNDSVFIDMKKYEMGFKIEGNTLKASGSAGEVAYTKK
ncbi:MAG TPA: hypothetical protein EYP36_08950 [Calditrichaeota bacterium]|nr:hypothetical protein [Calditrichota bacterium]